MANIMLENCHHHMNPYSSIAWFLMIFLVFQLPKRKLMVLLRWALTGLQQFKIDSVSLLHKAPVQYLG